MFLQELYYIPTIKIHHYTSWWSICQSVILSPCSRIQQWTSIFHLTLIKIAKQTYMNGLNHSIAVWFPECILTNLCFRVISNILLLIHHRPLNHVHISSNTVAIYTDFGICKRRGQSFYMSKIFLQLSTDWIFHKYLANNP